MKIETITEIMLKNMPLKDVLAFAVLADDVIKAHQEQEKTTVVDTVSDTFIEGLEFVE